MPAALSGSPGRALLSAPAAGSRPEVASMLDQGMYYVVAVAAVLMAVVVAAHAVLALVWRLALKRPPPPLLGCASLVWVCLDAMRGLYDQECSLSAAD